MKTKIAVPLVNHALQTRLAIRNVHRESIWQHECGRFLGGMTERQFISARWRKLVSVLTNGKRKKHFLIDVETSADILRTIRVSGCLKNGVQNCQEWGVIDVGRNATIWRDPELRAAHGNHVLSTTLDDILPELPTTKRVTRKASSENYRCKGCKHPSRMTHTALAEGVISLCPSAGTREDLIRCLDGHRPASYIQLETAGHFALGKGILSAPTVAALLDRATRAATVACSSRLLHQSMRTLSSVKGAKPVYSKLLRLLSLLTEMPSSDQPALAERFAVKERQDVSRLQMEEARLAARVAARSQPAGSAADPDESLLRLIRLVLRDELPELGGAQHLDDEIANAANAHTDR